MSDHFPGEITIGGDIPNRLLDRLSEMIASEGVSIDWQYALDRPAVRKAIEEAAAKGETARFTDDEAICGQFEDLEAFLVRHRIHFDRHSDARYEYDSENVYYRGAGKPLVVPSNQSKQDLASSGDILQILDNRKADKAKLEAIRKLIRVPAPLEPIRFTGPPPRTGGKP
jgi:hypothetical protein